MTANLAIMFALILSLSSSVSPVENERRRAPAATIRSERHVVQKRLTAEDVLGDLHTQESAVINENTTSIQCLGNPPSRGSCKELYDDDLKTSGYYRIYPAGEGEMVVFCDMSTDVDVNNRRPGYGWTVILRRLDSGTPSFNRSWQEYRNGFGCLNDSFWFGLQKIKHLVSHKLPGCTNTTHQLYVGMERYHPSTPFYNSAFYNAFSIGDKSENYKLNTNVVGGGSSYDGTLSSGTHDALNEHSGLQFSTYDNDNDIDSDGHCAASHGGGWWYRECIHSHLTGMFYSGGVMSGPVNDGIIWEGVTVADVESLNRVVMAIRPICND